MKVGFKRPKDFASQGEKYKREVKRAVTAELLSGLRGFQYSIMRTPVYTGRTLINYNWSLGAAVNSSRAAIKNPLLPGETSGLKIGAEPRRGPNAVVVDAEFQLVLAAIKDNPFQKVFLTNTTPYFLEVEYGSYATAAGAGGRTPPGGMVRRGETVLESSVGGLKKR